MLVAPVEIGEGARTGAGSVVTHDIPPHTLVVGCPRGLYASWTKVVEIFWSAVVLLAVLDLAVIIVRASYVKSAPAGAERAPRTIRRGR